MIKNSILLLSIAATGMLFSKTQEEKDALTAVGFAATKGLRDVSFAAYPKVATEDMEDAWDLISSKIKGITDADKPKHKSELTTKEAIQKETARVLRKHKDLVEAAGADLTRVK